MKEHPYLELTMLTFFTVSDWLYDNEMPRYNPDSNNINTTNTFVKICELVQPYRSNEPYFVQRKLKVIIDVRHITKITNSNIEIFAYDKEGRIDICYVHIHEKEKLHKYSIIVEGSLKNIVKLVTEKQKEIDPTIIYTQIRYRNYREITRIEDVNIEDKNQRQNLKEKIYVDNYERFSLLSNKKRRIIVNFSDEKGFYL